MGGAVGVDCDVFVLRDFDAATATPQPSPATPRSIELLAFTSTGQNIAASVAGAVAYMPPSDTWQTEYAYWANDLVLDPWIAAANNWITSSTGGPETWTLTFPPGPGYPGGGFPQPISSGAGARGGGRGWGHGVVLSSVATRWWYVPPWINAHRSSEQSHRGRRQRSVGFPRQP